jgi:hypothetical protein
LGSIGFRNRSAFNTYAGISLNFDAGALSFFIPFHFRRNRFDHRRP